MMGVRFPPLASIVKKPEGQRLQVFSIFNDSQENSSNVLLSSYGSIALT